MPKVCKMDDAWAVVSETGYVLASGLTNAQAWRQAEAMSDDGAEPSQIKRDFVSVAANHEEKQEWISALLGIALKKGRKPGWAAHVFKDRFGHWPDGLDDQAGPTFPAVNLFLRDRAGRSK